MRLDSQIVRRVFSVLVALGVILTPALALLHTHDVAHRLEGHAHHAEQAPDQVADHRHDGHAPARDDGGHCGLCDLVHQARADLSTPVTPPAAPAFTGLCAHLLPECPPRALTALVDAPPRGPPAL